MRRPRERLETVSGYYTEVLDAYAKLVWEVDAGLDGYHRTHGKHSIIVWTERWQLMYVYSHTVPQRMAEEPSKTGIRYDLRRHLMRLCTGDPWR